MKRNRSNTVAQLPALLTMFICVLTFIASTACVAADGGQWRNELQPPRTEEGARFLEIFRNADTLGSRKENSGYNVTEPVGAYVNECSPDFASVVRLLEDSGFEVVKNKQPIRKPATDQEYDDVFIARREDGRRTITFEGSERPLALWKSYRVVIYRKDNEIIHFMAFSSQDGI
ncbi:MULTISPECIES: hypothetical protein [unclassified Roseitalea]|uniref:hypothetical protein n=1 Tax=unclassified Roseitalea TaxID=2639107 RepID=UPI00273ED5C0|nr:MULTISPECIES: hypothetical protein [unclassified Roseitalea]